jgi:serine-type D-Ala-D-Ala carboxypeptidase/endopeptidase
MFWRCTLFFLSITTTLQSIALEGSVITNELDRAFHEIKDITTSTETLLKEYVDDNGGVGASVGVIDNGEIQFFLYGKKTVEEDEPISKDTIFEIGSITKVFTTLALVNMVDQGVVQLDDPIDIYLPNIKIPELNGKKITLRYLASHISGLPRLPDNLNPINQNNPYEDYTLENLYSYLNQHSLKKEPGESFEYSNTGMGLLGHILSIQSGKNYEELIKSLILEKLGMKNTTISLSPEMRKNFAHGHYLQKGVSSWDIPVLAGAGALRSNIQDMTQFLAVNMGFSESRLVNLMKQCHEKQYEISPEVSVGLGWIISHSNDSKIIWHNGETGGFRSYIGFNPKTKKGVVILSNSTEDWPDELGLVLLDPDHKRNFVNR